MKKVILCTLCFLKQKIQKLLFFILSLILLIAGVWMSAAMPVVLKSIPSGVITLFLLIALLLFFAGMWKKRYHLALLIMEAAFAGYFITLTPQEQFRNVEFQRVFATVPEIKYLDNDRFEVINIRRNRYPDYYDEDAPYNDIFERDVFDMGKVASVQFAAVHWGGMDLVAHTMLNFKFTDGKELTVSVEPRTPVGVDREAFTCMCKQQQLLFILSDTQDLFELRSRVRGENIYIYETTFTPQEARKLLEYIIARCEKLYREPEFYDLIEDNCITALLPGFKAARPDLQWDARIIFNGFFDRLLWEQGVLKCREDESFESLKSRSFIKGKSQGQL